MIPASLAQQSDELLNMLIGIRQRNGAFSHQPLSGQPPVEWYDAKVSERMPSLVNKGRHEIGT